MKYVLIILLASCGFNVRAQSIRTPEQQKTDSLFVFNKRYYELEDHYVVFSKNLNKYDKANFNKYHFGFVYFDELMGYTMIENGRFGIDGQGHVFREAADYVKNDLIKKPLQPVSKMVSAIPDSILNQLKVQPIPDWVVAYHREHPDKKTVAMKLHVGKLVIFSPDASKYIGYRAEVDGGIYKGEIREYKGDRKYALVLLYLGDPDRPAEDFIIVMKTPVKDNIINWVKALKPPVHNSTKIKRGEDEWGGNAAEGKIYLFEGKPAIMINSDDLMILEQVD